MTGKLKPLRGYKSVKVALPASQKATGVARAVGGAARDPYVALNLALVSEIFLAFSARCSYFVQNSTRSFHDIGGHNRVTEAAASQGCVR